MRDYPQRRLEVLSHEAHRVAQTPRAFRNWPRLLGDLAAQRVGRGPGTLTFQARTGLRIQTPNWPGARVPVYEIFAEDCYHFEWFLGPLLREPIQVLDIGGHVGTFACRLAQLNPQARISSYEPSSTTASFLRRNAATNGFADRVTVTDAAVAAENGTAMFDDNGAGSGTNGLVSAGGNTATATANVRTVDTITFDAAVEKAGGSVDVVKLDCEGGEYDLVAASSDASWSAVRRLVLEYHDVAGQSWEALRGHFTGLGFSVMRDDPVTERLGTAWLTRRPTS